MDGMGKDPYKPIKISWEPCRFFWAVASDVSVAWDLPGGFACGDFTPYI